MLWENIRFFISIQRMITKQRFKPNFWILTKYAQRQKLNVNLKSLLRKSTSNFKKLDTANYWDRDLEILDNLFNIMTKSFLFINF